MCRASRRSDESVQPPLGCPQEKASPCPCHLPFHLPLSLLLPLPLCPTACSTGVVLYDRLISIAANTVMLFPISEIFRQHHNSHHIMLGDYHDDVDVPCRWEVEFVGNSTWKKAVREPQRCRSLSVTLHACTVCVPSPWLMSARAAASSSSLVTTFSTNFAALTAHSLWPLAPVLQIWLTFNMVFLPIRSLHKLEVKWNKYVVLNWVVCLSAFAAVLLVSPKAWAFLFLSLLFSQVRCAR